MPVSTSGVMLGEVIVPNGVSIGRPPALRTPFAEVWQTAQSPSAANCCPRAMVAAENTDASGRAIGAIDRHGNTAVLIPTTAANSAATPAKTPLRRTNGFCHLSDGAAGRDGGAGNASGVGSSSPCRPLT